jgi:hypothetical protein
VGLDAVIRDNGARVFLIGKQNTASYQCYHKVDASPRGADKLNVMVAVNL